MKRTLITAFAVLMTALCPLHADEALDTFKKDITSLSTEISEQVKTMESNPLAGIPLMRNISVKLSQVKTDGLPEDLKATFGQFVGLMTKMGDVFSAWPSKPEEMQAFLMKKHQEDPQFMDAIGEKMGAIRKEMEPVAAKMDELGKKYDLDLKSLTPGR